MPAVEFTDRRQQMIAAKNYLAALWSAAIAFEGGHGGTAEGCIVHGQFLTRCDIAAGDQIQSIKPRVRITGVVDRSPLIGIVAPHYIDVGGQGPGVLLEPLLPQTFPMPVH